jgi:hypothetical protein
VYEREQEGERDPHLDTDNLAARREEVDQLLRAGPERQAPHEHLREGTYGDICGGPRVLWTKNMYTHTHVYTHTHTLTRTHTHIHMGLLGLTWLMD